MAPCLLVTKSSPPSGGEAQKKKRLGLVAIVEAHTSHGVMLLSSFATVYVLQGLFSRANDFLWSSNQESQVGNFVFCLSTIYIRHDIPSLACGGQSRRQDLSRFRTATPPFVDKTLVASHCILSVVLLLDCFLIRLPKKSPGAFRTPLFVCELRSLIKNQNNIFGH